MCKFCDNLKYRKYRIQPRTTSSDDTTCEFGSPDLDVSDTYNCRGCRGCADDNHRFELISWENYISLAYVHRIRRLVIEPYSENIQINFCPWCGKQLSDELVDFDKCHLGRELKLLEDD